MALRSYEAVLIISPKAEEEAINSVVEKFENLIKKMEGKIARTDRWGVRKLAYPILGNTDGYYAIISFNGNNDCIDELHRVLKISDEIIRHMIVKVPSVKRKASN
ncbi:MAG: 30S ribosomal protein S6 [Actinobacteria bacterium]|nr:30S ribosomal protein S6 [Actinomycetota bacterium]